MRGYKVSQGLNQVSKSPKALKNQVWRLKWQFKGSKPHYKGPGTEIAKFKNLLTDQTGQATRVSPPYRLTRAASDCQRQKNMAAAIPTCLTDLNGLFCIPGAAPMVFHA
ncbi:hypothetical protein Hanom_Chr07g00605261 [Helianthus anomalus]